MHIDMKTQRPDVFAHITWPETEKYPNNYAFYPLYKIPTSEPANR